MLPVLLDLKIIKIYTFGIFLVLAFFWGSFLLWKNIKLTSYKEDDIFDGLFFSLIGALFFGRLIYVIFHFDIFGFSILKFILINGYPGISLIGSLLGGLLTFYLFCVFKKIPWLNLIDYLISPLFLALGFGKLGSFLSGVEIGTKTKIFLSMRFIGAEGFRHLTALYESLIFFIGFYFAYKLLFAIRKGKYPQGFGFGLLCWLFGLVYFLFDKIKGNHIYFLSKSFNGLAGLVIFTSASFYFIYYFKGTIIDYAKKSIKRVHTAAKSKTRSGEKKDTSTD